MCHYNISIALCKHRAALIMIQMRHLIDKLALGMDRRVHHCMLFNARCIHGTTMNMIKKIHSIDTINTTSVTLGMDRRVRHL